MNKHQHCHTFDEFELDVLFYLFTYLSVHQVPPSIEEVRSAVCDPNAVSRLIQDGFLCEAEAKLVPNHEQIAHALPRVQYSK